MYNFIAADGGGTKTELVLFNETGHIIYRDLSAGSNAMDIGKSEALRRVLAAVGRTAEHAEENIVSFCGGIAGTLPLGDFISGSIKELLPDAIVRVEDDGGNMISGEFGQADGCGMVCGTGSSLFIRKGGRIIDKLGGKGYLIDTGGSGYELGRDAIRMAMRSAEGRCAHTALEELVSEAMGKPVLSSMPDIYDPMTGGRAYIASFAHTVFEGRAAGDWASIEIFENGAASLAELTRAAERYFDGDFSVVISGGIARAYPEYCDAVRAKGSLRADIVTGTVPPIYGAACGAIWNFGMETNGDFKARFLADYKR